MTNPRLRSLPHVLWILALAASACSSPDASEDALSDADSLRHRPCDCTCPSVPAPSGSTLPSPSPSPTTPSTEPATPTPTAPASPSSPSSSYARPFVATSSWNTPLPSTATYRRLGWPAANGYNYTVNWETYSPAIHVAKSTDPVVQVSFPASWGWPAQTLPVRIPAGATGAVGTDGEILAIDGTTVHNFWQFKRTSTTTATASAYGRTDVVTGTGWGSKSPFQSAGIVAAGSSQLAGLLVEAETDAGEIEHALALSLDTVLQKPGAVGEAISSDGHSPTGIVQEGERLAIPRGAAMPAGLSPLGQKIFRAVQKYGAFSIDVAGGTTTFRAQANAYDAPTMNAARKDANVIIPMLQHVDP